MADKKKIAIGTLSVLTAAALVLGGTFAWQSISQTALNEKEAVINPGGRLHDDFNGTNKDVYVENFADDDIFARVRLEEYFEIVMNKGTSAENTEQIVGSKTVSEDQTEYAYKVHIFGTENATDDWWNWTTGGSTVYMPTFNKNKDSLKADVNGTFENDYEDYVEYTKGDEVTDDATHDNDSNNVEDENVVKVEETHIATETGTATLISIDEWLELAEDGEETANYWVYDTDGWVYWSSPIKADTATGLLLDEISLKHVMDDSYYYAINVVGQFITADDLGKDDGTGFYADKDSIPSENALKLLKTIGVTVSKDIIDGDADDSDNTEDDIEVTSLTVISPTEGKGVYSVEGNLGRMFIGAIVRINDDQKPCNSEYELIDGFTMKIYEKGGTDPVCVKTGKDLMYDWDHDEIIANVTNDGLNMSHSGETEFEVEFIYSKGSQTITADKVSYTFESYVFDLTETGSTYERFDTQTCAFITLNGAFPNWADLKFSKDGTELVCMLNSSGQKAYYSDTKDGDVGNAWMTLDALPSPIRFHAQVAGTYTISIEVDGTTYTSTIKVTEAQ